MIQTKPIGMPHRIAAPSDHPYKVWPGKVNSIAENSIHGKARINVARVAQDMRIT